MPRRPRLVTTLAVLVLILAVWNGVRFYSALQSWSLLTELRAHPGPFYIALTGLLWAAAGLTLFRGLWVGRSWAQKGARIYFALYLAYFWVDRLLFRPAERAQNYALLLLLQLALISLTALAFWTTSGKSFFR